MQTITSLLRNSLSSIVTNLLNRAGNVVLFILIVRHLGVEKAGLYTLGISFFFISSRFSFWGLDHLLTREVAKTHTQATLYISNLLFVRVVLSTPTIIVFLLIVQLTNYTSETKLLISLMLLSVWPESINNLCWAGFAAFEEFYFTSVSVFFASLIQISAGWLLLSQDYGVVEMAWVFFANNMVAMVINLLIMQRRYRIRWQPPSRSFIQAQMRQSIPFLFISIFFILDNRLDNVLLSFISSEEAIGIYNAAAPVILGLSMVAEGFRIAVFPILSRYAQTDMSQAHLLYTRSFKYLVILSLPLSAITIIASAPLIQLLYGDPLPLAVTTLQILAWQLVFLFINILNNRLFVAYNRQDLAAYFLGVTVLSNIIINLILAPSLGPIGASIARLSSIIILFLLNQWAISTYFPAFKLSIWSMTWRPLLATFAMISLFWGLAPWGIGLQLLCGLILYVALLYLLGVVSTDEKKIVLAFVQHKRRRYPM